MTLGSIIEEKRKEKNLTQEQLAEMLGTTKSTVSRWESGKLEKMKAPMIAKLNQILGIEISLFFQRKEVLWPDEYAVISAYRTADNATRLAVRKLLEVKG